MHCAQDLLCRFFSPFKVFLRVGKKHPVSLKVSYNKYFCLSYRDVSFVVFSNRFYFNLHYSVSKSTSYTMSVSKRFHYYYLCSISTKRVLGKIIFAVTSLEAEVGVACHFSTRPIWSRRGKGEKLPILISRY